MLTDAAAAVVHAQSFQKYVPLLRAAENRDTGFPLWSPAAPSSSSPAPLPLSPPFSQVVTQPDAHCAHRGVIIGTLCFYCLQLF